MRLRHIAIALAFACSPGAVQAAGDEVFASDPRVIEANALLSDESQRDRAIQLYQSVLSEQPDNRLARMWLARVLAWNGAYDRSLAQYRHFLDHPDPPDWAEIERAEVLSWAGRYDQAETAFQNILERETGNARAARGLARVYRWSGRRSQADEAYQKALAMEEDTEARREWKDMQSAIARHTEGDTQFFQDSDDFRKTRVTARGFMDLNWNTRLLASAAFTRVEHDREPTDDGRERDDAIDAILGVERRFADGQLKASAEAGARRWSHSRDRFLARGGLEYKTPIGTNLGLRLAYDDLLKNSNSLEAVEEDLTDASARLWAWHGFTPAIEGYAYLDGSLISDSNRRLSAGLSGSYQPWADRELRLTLAASYLTFAQKSDYYYDPDTDTGAELSLDLEHPFHEKISFALRAATGLGYTLQDGADGFGFTYSVGGGPTWSQQGWWVSLQGSRSQSRRTSAYTTHGVSLSLGRGF